MNTARKQKLLYILFLLFLLGVVVALVMYALRQNISLFYTPSQLQEASLPSESRVIRLGGIVVKGSIQKNPQDLSLRFQVTDHKKTIWVHYQGILPDLFREGQGIVAKGRLQAECFFASEILAKHDANYMPLELASSLAKKDA